MFVSKSAIRLVMAVGVVGLMCVPMARGGHVRAQALAGAPRAAPQGISDSAAAFRADILIRHERRSADGALVGRSVERTMHIERHMRQGRSRTTLRMNAPRRALLDTPGRKTTITNPAYIARIEFDDDGGTPRMYDAAGRVVTPLSGDLMRLLQVAPARRGAPSASRASGHGFVFGSFVADASGRQERRDALRGRFGAPVGRVRGLDRFTRATDDEVTEVLAIPDEGLPVETVTSSTKGRTRTSITYSAAGRRGQVRRLTRTEATFGDSSDRLVTEIQLSNVVIDDEVLP